MRERFDLHVLPPLSVLSAALAAGVLEWIALWRSRRYRRVTSVSRH